MAENMSNFDFIQKIKFIFSRMIFLYIALSVVFMFTIDYQTAFRRVQLAALNRFRPEQLEMILQLSAGPEWFDKKELQKFAFYFQKVTEYVPMQADAYGLLGLSSYYLGDSKKAIKSFQKAIEIKGDFFWFYHNLGVLYFKEGDYPRAITMMKKAVELKAEPTVKFIVSSSRMFLPILAGYDGDKEKRLSYGLKSGYRNAFAVMALSFNHMDQYQSMFNVAREGIEADVDIDGYLTFLVGLASYKMNQFSEAVFYFQECLKRNNNDPEAIEHLGLTLQKVGKQDLAQPFLQKAAFLENSQKGWQPKEKRISLEVF